MVVNALADIGIEPNAGIDGNKQNRSMVNYRQSVGKLVGLLQVMGSQQQRGQKSRVIF